MNTFVRVLVALVAGILGFAVVTVAVTVGFAPEIEFSLLIGLPMGVYAGLTTVFATYAGLWYRDQVAAGPATERATRVLWSAAAAVAAFVVTTVLGVLLYLVFDVSIGIGVLVLGVPAVVFVAAVGGYIAARTGREGEAGRQSSSG
ncbi:hypothetical protein [Haloarchaeobius sp. DT45]|uniref:hypothetical protein n=1 Tax=Haloarchaeobius sp. DT45 TaxID=3446116 RepID=UPI003F6CDAF5